MHAYGGGVRSELQSAGHDVDWAGDWTEDPGDEEILERAHREGRVLVTLDKDFGELTIVHGAPHSGIIRLVNLSSYPFPEYRRNILKRFNVDPLGSDSYTQDLFCISFSFLYEPDPLTPKTQRTQIR
jgi:predicted nuclease of predicted toxin-antitoxin system